MEKFYLGVSLGFNSSAAIFGTESGLLCAVSEERLNRIKNTKMLPFDAIIACCKMAAIRARVPSINIDEIVYSHYEDISMAYLKKNVPMNFTSSSEVEMYKGLLPSFVENDTERMLFYKYISDFINNNQNCSAEDLLKKSIRAACRYYNFNAANNITRVEHHKAHEYSSFPVYGRNEKTFLTMTADGFGDGFSGRITFYDKGKETVLSQVRVIDSPALVYQFFTGALGFKEHQHEGKVTGLAAHCEATPEKSIEIYKALLKALTGKEELDKSDIISDVDPTLPDYQYYNSGFWVDESLLLPLTEEQVEMAKTSTIVDFERFLRLKNTVYAFVKDYLGENYDKDNILDWLNGNKEIPEDMKATPWELAFAVQYFAEKVILNWIECIPEDIHGIPLYCAGGLVANVKLNQRIKDTGYFSKVFVAPPMGDEGTAIGSALYKMEKVDGHELVGRTGPETIINGGTLLDINNELDKIAETASAMGLNVVKYFNKSQLIDIVTDMLADEKIVHWCQQAEEFGPRALMNHSTLYTAQDPNGTHTLNQAMGRSEYMPYCPVCKNTSAPELFDNWEVGEESCRFMAMTMNCKPGVREQYRGGVHVDNTARAQFIYEGDTWTKDAYELLDSYESKTGNKMMINTSFNIHNTPTCNLANDCWEAWVQSEFVGEALVMGGYLFTKPEGFDATASSENYIG